MKLMSGVSGDGSDSSGACIHTKILNCTYTCLCLGKLPAHGGGYEVTKLEELSPEAAGATDKVG